ncbi:MAG: diguanylate cyclase (GGDEF)-like protein/PAS domain S-box-containing protein [Paraglaciecola sp.]
MKNNLFKNLFLLLAATLCFTRLTVAEPVVLQQNLVKLDLLKHTQWLVTNNRAQLSDIQDLQNWRTIFYPHPLQANQSLWGKVQLQSGYGAQEYFLSIGNPHLDIVDVYVLDQRNRILSSYAMGATRSNSARPYPHRLFVVPLDIPIGQPINVYFRVLDDGPLVFPLQLYTAAELVTQEQRSIGGFAFLSGTLAIMAMYFLVTYTLLRSPVRFWFSVAIAGYLLLFLNVKGLVSQLSGISAYISYVTTFLCGLLLFSLAKVTFTILEKVPTYYRYCLYVLALFTAASTLILTSYQQILVATVAGIISVVMIAVLSIFYRDKDKTTANRIFASGVVLITVTYIVHLGLYLKGGEFSQPLSLALNAVIILGIMLIAVAIAAHEKVHSFRQQATLHDTIGELQLYFNLFFESAEGRYLSTPKGALLKVNRAMCILFGYDNEEQMLADTETTAKFYADPQDRELLMGELQRDTKVLGKEIRGLRKDGSEFWFSISAQRKQNEKSAEKFIFGSVFDISQRKKSDMSLEYIASHDALTGIYNRQEFENKLRNALHQAQIQQTELTLLYIDIDQFKIVNDTCGHKAGDLLLKQLADMLSKTVAQQGVLARLGGDEFGILLQGDNAQKTYMLANELLTGVQEFRFIWEKQIFTLCVSIGQVSWQADISNYDQLLSMADSACFMAKERGRNQIHTYSAEDQHMLRYESELAWLSQIQYALQSNSFELFFQKYLPMTKVEDGYHYEILLRMRGDNNEIILPGAFLPAAERYNLSPRIDRWVIETYFQWLVQNPLHQQALFRCNINLSGHSLGDKDLKLFILNAFEKYAIPYDKICFEITESMAILKMDETLEFIDTFRQLGCKFALDDFGSGFSSYNYLKNLPVDQVKIDGDFVKNILIDTVDLAMVRSIKDVATAMGIETIAEFVESKEIMVQLGKMGVDFAQGYGVDKPSTITMLADSQQQGVNQ